MSRGDGIVGRSDELAAMAFELDRARAGLPGVLLVAGVAGIGKTSLVHRFLTGEPDVAVLRAGGEESEVALAFGVIGQLVADVPPDMLGPLLGAGPAAGADPLAVGAELLGALGALQAAGPVVVVVDDAQWADDPAAQALVFAVRRLRRDQVLVVLCVRDDEHAESGWWDRAQAQGGPVRRLVLGGLDAEEIVALAKTVGGPALTLAAGRRLREHTGGHPMHVRALLRELPAEALLDTGRVLPAPRSLAALVLAQVAALPAPAQDLVVAAAVLGTRCALPHAVALAAVTDPLAALDAAVRAGLLAEVFTGTGHDVVFSHQLVRAAVYADLPPARRHALHRAAAGLTAGAAATGHRIAAAVGADPVLAAELTELGRDELAARRWRPAADHLMSAAELSAAPQERAGRLVEAVDAMLAGGDVARAARSEPELRAIAPGPARSGVLGRLEALTGRFAAARTTLSATLDAADGDGAGRSAAAAHLAMVSLVEGTADAAAELAARALQGRPAPEVASLARFVRVVALVVQGRHGEAGAALAAGPAAESSALRGVLALWDEDAVGAAAELSAAVRDGASEMSMQARVLVLAHLAEARYRVGDWDRAATAGALAVSLARDAGVLVGGAITNALASHVESSRGAWETAAARVAATTAATEALPWWGGRGYAATAQAVLAQARGDHAAMLEALAPFTDPAVLGPVDRAGLLPWRALLVEALLGTGQLDAAAAELRALEHRVAGRPPGWTAVEAARLRAAITEVRDGDPRPAYEHALELAGRTSAELSRARIETGYGRHLLAAGERRLGVDLLRAAHERLERLGATPFLERSDEQLRAAGLHPPAAGGALGLTAHELAVARLVAEGRTNQEVGAALFVTGRTVAFHLSNIYAKLGISSRRQLAAHLPEVPA